MLRLEQLQRGSLVKGLTGDGPATVIDVKWYGSACVELTFKDPAGTVENELLYRDAEARLELVESGRSWTFNGDAAMFRLASEAYRIHLAPVWEGTQHLIRALEEKGETGAAEPAAKLGGVAETARELAYRLYSLCEKKGRTDEAIAYNSLVFTLTAG